MDSWGRETGSSQGQVSRRVGSRRAECSPSTATSRGQQGRLASTPPGTAVSFLTERAGALAALGRSAAVPLPSPIISLMPSPSRHPPSAHADVRELKARDRPGAAGTHGRLVRALAPCARRSPATWLPTWTGRAACSGSQQAEAAEGGTVTCTAALPLRRPRPAPALEFTRPGTPKAWGPASGAEGSSGTVRSYAFSHRCAAHRVPWQSTEQPAEALVRRVVQAREGVLAGRPHPNLGWVQASWD
jgi:hypothetical protein